MNLRQAVKPVRTLLIEDDSHDARLFLERLRHFAPGEFEVTQARTLAAGIEEAEYGDYSVAVLDLTLPDSSGLVTCARFQDANPAVPVVVLTGIADRSLCSIAERAGISAALFKDDCGGQHLAAVLRSASERSGTDRIPVRAARAAAAARFRNAIVDSADGIVVQDSAGKVLLVSHSAEQLLGRTAAEITGSSLGLDISGGLPVRVHVVYERDGTTEFPRDGGEPRHFDVSQLKITELEVWPFPHEWAGTPVTVCAIRDVSQQSWDEYRQRQIASFDTPLHIAGGLKEACTDLALRLGRVVRYNRIELAIWRPDVRRHQVVFELGLTVHGRAIGSLVDRGTSPVQFGTWMERDTAVSPATGFVAIGHARHGEYGDREADALRRCAAAMGSVVSSVKADPIFGQYDAEQDRRGVTGRYPLSEAA